MHELYNEKINEKVYWMNQSEYDKIDWSYSPLKFEFRWWKVVWLLISSKHFRWKLKNTLLYAIRWQNGIRGNDSCDAYLFTCYYFNNIFEVKKEKE
jgi:hypothetical protein